MRQSLNALWELNAFQRPLQILKYQSTGQSREALFELDKLMPLPTADIANKAVSSIFHRMCIQSLLSRIYVEPLRLRDLPSRRHVVVKSLPMLLVSGEEVEEPVTKSVFHGVFQTRARLWAWEETSLLAHHLYHFPADGVDYLGADVESALWKCVD